MPAVLVKICKTMYRKDEEQAKEIIKKYSDVFDDIGKLKSEIT